MCRLGRSIGAVDAGRLRELDGDDVRRSGVLLMLNVEEAIEQLDGLPRPVEFQLDPRLEAGPRVLACLQRLAGVDQLGDQLQHVGGGNGIGGRSSGPAQDVQRGQDGRGGGGDRQDLTRPPVLDNAPV